MPSLQRLDLVSVSRLYVSVSSWSQHTTLIHLIYNLGQKTWHTRWRLTRLPASHSDLGLIELVATHPTSFWHCENQPTPTLSTLQTHQPTYDHTQTQSQLGGTKTVQTSARQPSLILSEVTFHARITSLRLPNMVKIS